MRQIRHDTDALTVITGVGRSIAADLQCVGTRSVADVKGKYPESLYDRSNREAGVVQDRCLLYVFRCAVYYAGGGRDAEKLKWWNRKDRHQVAESQGKRR